MLSKNTFWIGLFFVCILASCNKMNVSNNLKDHFFIESKKSIMPVFVNGNYSSKTFLLYLHGGPGGTSLDAYQNNENPFYKLQNDLVVVYWEQRCAGNTQGSCDNLTLNQYVEDLEKLIILLQSKYGSDIKLFLLGHSWGGTLGIKYLSNTLYQSKIKGWIEVGGGHHVPRIATLEKEMLISEGNKEILAGRNINEWNEIITKANTLNITKIDDLFEMNRLSVQAENIMKQNGTINSKIINSWFHDYFFSPQDISITKTNLALSAEKMKNELASINLSDSLQKIEIPVLMVWGKYDFRVPPKFAQEELIKYGSAKKDLVILDKSAHFVQFNEPQLFYENVKLFIEKNL